MSRELTDVKTHLTHINILAKELVTRLRRIQPKLARAASVSWEGNAEEDFKALLLLLPDLEAALGESELLGYVNRPGVSPEGERIRRMSMAMKNQARQAFTALQPLGVKKTEER